MTIQCRALIVACAIPWICISISTGQEIESTPAYDALPILDSSIGENCGVGCTYLALRMFDKKPRLEDLVSEFSMSNGYVSLSQCAQALTARGLTVRSFEVENKRDILNYPGIAILSTLLQEGDPVEGHFVLYLGNEDAEGMIAFASPEEYIEMSFSEFEKTWPGKAMLISEDPKIISAWTNQVSRPSRISWANPYGIIIIGIGGLSLLLWNLGSRKVSRNPR